MGTIELQNTNRNASVTVRSFDGDEITLPAGQQEPVPVDEKFGWQLPPGVKNKTQGKSYKNRDLTEDPDKETPPPQEDLKNQNQSSVPDKIVTPTQSKGTTATTETDDTLNKTAAIVDQRQPAKPV